MFVDLARSLAAALMVQGHTLDALLDKSYQTRAWAPVWMFQRGLTSCLFLTLSGFVFSVATTRRWHNHLAPSWAMVSRARRFVFFMLLGYAMRVPARGVMNWRFVTPEGWQSFLGVDVLQLIGVMLLLLQALVMIARTPWAFGVVSFVGFFAVVLVTPLAWAVNWPAHVPLSVASYLSLGTGSQFPIVPWGGFMLFGAGLGQVYSHWGAAHLEAFTNRVLLGGGAALALGAVLCGRLLPFAPFGATDFWTDSPNQYYLRAGAVLMLLGGVAILSRRITRLPHVFAAMAQETLLVYFVHLAIVYGSPWNHGLRSYLGTNLPLSQTAVIVVTLVASMALLAAAWNWAKHAHARAARVVTAGAVAYLLWGLL